MVPSISFSGRESRHADKIFAFPSRTEFSVTTPNEWQSQAGLFHVMPHELMVLALLFNLEHMRNGDVAQPCGGNRLGDVPSQPPSDAVLREQTPKPLVVVHGELRIIPLVDDPQHTTQSIVD